MDNLISSVEKYFLPASLDAARRHLKAGNGGYVLIGGGTGFTFSAPKYIRGIIDLSKAGLDYITNAGDGIHIGAAAPLGTLLKNPLLKKYCGGVIGESVLTIATTPLRNLITVGGNAVQVFIWSSLPVLFLALDAQFVTIGGRRRIFKADEFFKSQPRRQMGEEAILKEIILPRQKPSSAAAFLKFSKTETDFALLNIAVYVSIARNKCHETRIALGAATPLPIRLTAAEEALKGEVLTEDNIALAAGAGADMVNYLKDMRVLDGYKKQAAPALIRRCIQMAVERAKAKSNA